MDWDSHSGVRKNVYLSTVIDSSRGSQLDIISKFHNGCNRLKSYFGDAIKKVHLNGWAARAFWDEWELAGDMSQWEELESHAKSILIRLNYIVMFLASNGALGCSFYRIFRVQQTNTAELSGAQIPDRAVYIAAVAMSIGTGSIAVRYDTWFYHIIITLSRVAPLALFQCVFCFRIFEANLIWINPQITFFNN